MKITSFRPLIITGNAEATIELFEALGFERRHEKTGINDADISSIAMKDANGFNVNIASVEKLPRDMTVVNMNVDNFQEAYELLTAHGFKNAQGEKVTDTGTSHATLMVSPSGFAINIAEHIK